MLWPELGLYQLGGYPSWWSFGFWPVNQGWPDLDCGFFSVVSMINGHSWCLALARDRIISLQSSVRPSSSSIDSPQPTGFLSGAWQWSWAQRLSPDYPISNEPIICRNLFALMVLICLIFPHLAFLSFGSSAIDLLSKEGSREKLPRGAIYILMCLAWWERYDPGVMGIHAQDDDGRTHCCKES